MSPKRTLLLFLIFTFSLSIHSQNLAVETNFKPAVSKYLSSENFISALQPDGKILVAPEFQVVNGQIVYNFVRLNTDGSIDTTFNCQSCDLTITDIRLQQDGKILVGGKAGLVDKLYRLNSDGSKDNSFNYSSLSNGSNAVSVEIKGIQPDGKVFVIFRTNGAAYFFRLNTDGSLDNSFTPFFANTNEGQRINAKILPDGRLFIFGNTSYGQIAQVNFDGSKNNAFESPSVFGGISDITLQPDGKIAFIGDFTSVNGVSRKYIARLNADQSLDLNFNPTIDYPSPSSGIYKFQIIALSNSKLLVGDSRLSFFSGQIVRLNNDGTIDNTFTRQPSLGFNSMKLDASERIYAFVSAANANLVRLNADGSIDTAYTPLIEASAKVTGLGLQSDGKILVGGTYRKVNGFLSSGVSRLNPDGTTDTTFTTNERFGSSTIGNFGVQSDGKILVAGAFFYNGTLKAIVRLNADGSEDSSFNVTIMQSFNPRISDVEVEPDGKILIAGTFISVNGVSRSGIARLNSDGTLDTSYNVQLGASAAVSTILKQSDGKYLIAGFFTGVNGFNRMNLARLNADGTLDTSFNASVPSISKVVLSPDGKYVAISPTAVHKLNADGSAASGFQTPTLGTNGSITSVEVLNDNSIVISGSLVAVNGTPRKGLARLNTDGSLNSASFPNGTDVPPTVLLKQTDGRLLTGGEFKYIENIMRTGLARISLNTVSRAKPFDFDGDGRTDIVVYRPSNSVWYQLLGSNYQFSSVSFGASNDVLAPADYDGDGKTDLGIFRPSTGAWWYRSSAQGNAFRAVQWGQSGDIPLPSDFNGDGKDDFVVYRPSNNTWYRLTDTGTSSIIQFGAAGDKPVIGDFDGDGKADPAIFRPSTGAWWYAASSQNNTFRAAQFGASGDIPAVGDYDGDGRTDLAVYRPTTGAWYILNSGNNSVTIIGFGLNGDKPITGDYDGDGKADIAVYRPSNGVWYLYRSTAGFAGVQLGTNTDLPIPNAFVSQ